MKTCLQIVSSACKRLGLNAPAAVVTSSDPQYLQFLELLNEEGQELSARFPWQSITNEVSFTTVATESQGSMSTLAPNYNYIINDTIWNRTLRRPVFGPKAAQTWQQQKAFAINGPWSNYRIYGDALHMFPVPTAGQSCYFEYVSKNWITLSAGGTASEFANDADTPLLDDECLLLGLLWRWKAMKGLDYGEDFNKYEKRVLDAYNRDAGRDWLNLSNTRYDIFPGVVVPAGSWGV